MTDNQSTEQRAAANGSFTNNGVPHGFTSLTPFLAIPGAKDALTFYAEVFGARALGVTEFDGVVVHAELDFGHGRLQIGEPSPNHHLVRAPERDDDCYSMGFYCADVDALVERAAQAGAVIREPVTNFISGDRFASIRDPYGVRWSIMTRVEDLSSKESARRVDEWAATQS